MTCPRDTPMSEPHERAEGTTEDGYLDLRLVPPPVEEYKVMVRFRCVGEERPRVEEYDA